MRRASVMLLVFCLGAVSSLISIWIRQDREDRPVVGSTLVSETHSEEATKRRHQEDATYELKMPESRVQLVEMGQI